MGGGSRRDRYGRRLMSDNVSDNKIYGSESSGSSVVMGVVGRGVEGVGARWVGG